MKSVGNVKARAQYEFNTPIYYARPTESESAIVRENWIRAKYVRKEFIEMENDDGKDNQNPAVFSMPAGALEGFLWKQNPKGVWQKRWFVLLGRYLYWYKSPDVSIGFFSYFFFVSIVFFSSFDPYF